jgi:POT family proton-dependent oligopeptide transporter
LFSLTSTEEKDNQAELLAYLQENNITKENPYHAKLLFEKDEEKAKVDANKGDGKDYGVSFVVEEEQSALEFGIFKYITLFTVIFGILLILFLKRLKKLTHGAEDNEREIHDEAEGFELADN